MKKMLSVILMVLMVVVVGLMFTGCSGSKTSLTLKGNIEFSEIPSCSQVTGMIVKFNKDSGEQVKKGDVIAVVENTTQKFSVSQLSDVVNMKKSRLSELKAGTRSQLILQSEALVRGAKAQWDLAVLNEGKVSPPGIQTQLQTQSVDAAKANYDAANANLALLNSGSTKQTINVAQYDLDQAQSQLNQAKNILSKYNITALEDGVIVSKNFDIGNVVTIGSDIVDIAVTKQLYVTSFLPVEYLGSISYNQPLNVTTENGVQTGKVTFIALKNEYIPNDQQSIADKSKTTKIKIEITDAKGNLKPGMTATFDLPIVK